VSGPDLDGYACLDAFDRLVEQGQADALAQATWCNGDTRDAKYLSSPKAPLGWGEALYLVGVNHERSGVASYLGIAVHDQQTSAGLASVFGVSLRGSAKAYLPAEIEQRFYVLRIAHACGERPYCLPIGDVPLRHDLSVVVRAYVNPATGVGPASADLLPARVISVPLR
jgi:hypothetical protein